MTNKQLLVVHFVFSKLNTKVLCIINLFNKPVCCCLISQPGGRTNRSFLHHITAFQPSQLIFLHVNLSGSVTTLFHDTKVCQRWVGFNYPPCLSPLRNHTEAGRRHFSSGLKGFVKYSTQTQMHTAQPNHMSWKQTGKEKSNNLSQTLDTLTSTHLI